MLAFTRSCAEDDAAYGRLIEDIAACDVGHGYPQVPGCLIDGFEKHLKLFPSSGDIYEAFVLHLRPGAQFLHGGFRFAQPALGQEAAGDGSEGQNADAAIPAQFRHFTGCPLVKKGIAHLVGQHLYTAFHDDVQVGRIDIGQSEMTDQPFLAKFLQPEEAVEPGGVGVIPGVELQQVYGIRLQPVEGALNGFPGLLPAGGAWFGHPFGEQLHFPGAGVFFAEDAGNLFGRAVVISHVEAGEAGLCIGGQRPGCRFRIEFFAVAFQVGDLPQTGEDPGDAQVGGKLKMDCMLAHGSVILLLLFLPIRPWLQAGRPSLLDLSGSGDPAFIPGAVPGRGI